MGNIGFTHLMGDVKTAVLEHGATCVPVASIILIKLSPEGRSIFQKNPLYSSLCLLSLPPFSPPRSTQSSSCAFLEKTLCPGVWMLAHVMVANICVGWTT